MLTDTHAHLDYPDFAEDLPAVLERAREAGVARVVTIGTSLEGSARCLELAERFPMVWAAVGVHPGSLDEGATMDRARLRELARHPRAAAIGEAGLDYYRPPEGAAEAALAAWKERQHAAFAAQVEGAAELGMNVVVHQRAAWADTLAAVRPFTGRLRAVFHCFGGTPAEAAEVIALGHLVSFTGIVTFKNAPGVRESAAAVPADRLMVETDCPFLAPAPYRGRRCEPTHVRLVADKIAEARGASLEEFAAQTERNAEAFFRFGAK